MDSDERARVAGEDDAPREDKEKEEAWLKEAAARWERKKAEESAQREGDAAPADAEHEVTTPHPMPEEDPSFEFDPLPPVPSAPTSAALSAPPPAFSNSAPPAFAKSPPSSSPNSAPSAFPNSAPSGFSSPSTASPAARRQPDELSLSIEDLARAALAPGESHEPSRAVAPVIVPIARSSPLQPPSREVLLPNPNVFERGLAFVRGLPAAAKLGAAGAGGVALIAIGWLALRAPATPSPAPSAAPPVAAKAAGDTPQAAANSANDTPPVAAKAAGDTPPQAAANPANDAPPQAAANSANDAPAAKAAGDAPVAAVAVAPSAPEPAPVAAPATRPAPVRSHAPATATHHAPPRSHAVASAAPVSPHPTHNKHLTHHHKKPAPKPKTTKHPKSTSTR